MDQLQARVLPLCTRALTDSQCFADWLKSLRQCEWVVYAKRPFAGPEAMLAYLSRYTHRVAITNSRLISFDQNSSQYLSIRYSERLAEAGFQASVGSVGDSYDNALAETMNGLYKAEVIHKDGPWKGVDDVASESLIS